MKTSAARVSGKHIALFCFALLAVALAGLALFSRAPPIAVVAACPSVPTNVKTLGPALQPAQVSELLAAPGRYSAELRQLFGPGITLHEFRTGVTGGHAAIRGRCYVGQAVAWIR